MTICRSRNLIGIVTSGEMGHWQRVLLQIAGVEEENALRLKLENKKIDGELPFSCFSTETGQDTMKKIQGASTVENTSLKSARIILSTVVI